MKCSETTNRGNWQGRLVAVAMVLVYAAAVGVAAYGADSTTPKTSGKSTTPAAAPAPVKTATPPAKPLPAPDIPEPPAGTGDTIKTTDVGEGKIDLRAKNEDLANVLELLAQQYQLNIIVSRGAKGRVTVDLYKATIAMALNAICRANDLKWTQEGNSIYVFTVEEGTAMRMNESRLVTEVFVLNYLPGEDAIKMIAPALSAKATVAVNAPPQKGLVTGLPTTSGNSYGLQDSLVIRDFPENLDAVRRLLKTLDARPKQVIVEATILQVKLEDDTSMGINFNSLAGVNFKDLSTTAMPVTNPGSVANSSTTTVPASKAPFLAASATGFAAPGTGLNIGIVTNNIAVFVNALEAVTDTTILSNPKVLSLNKNQGEVIVGQRLGYRTSTVTETTTVDTVQFLATGTQLIFTPFISDDGYVRMQIHPKVSSGAVIGGLPQETTTEVTADIMVKDGNTVVIGGLFDETATISRSQVPGLGNLPGLGWLFRSNEDKSTRNEIVVLLTPHIIDNDEAADAIGKQAIEDAKRHCLGMRENFAFFTRERITVAYLQEAERSWKQYEETGRTSDLDRALWKVELALGVGPNNLKAMHLKDKILSEKQGEPFETPNWTIWDGIQQRLRQMDEAKADARKTQPVATESPVQPPATPAVSQSPEPDPADAVVAVSAAATTETPVPAPAEAFDETAAPTTDETPDFDGAVEEPFGMTKEAAHENH